MNIILLLFNIVISIFGIKHAFKIKSFIIFWWGYILYFAVLYFFYCSFESIHYFEWSGKSEYIPKSIKQDFFIFVTLTNSLILLSFRLIRKKIPKINFIESKLSSKTIIIYLILLLSSFLFLIYNIDYGNYGELTSSDDFGGWAWVFTQVSFSLVILAFYKRNYKIIALIFIFSLIYTMIFLIRSIFIYSVFTMILLYVMKLYYQNISLTKILIKIAVPILIVGFFSSLALNLRGVDIRLPESKLVNYSIISYKNSKESNFNLGVNDFKYYYRGILNPLSRFFDKKEDLITSPIYNARIVHSGDYFFDNFNSFFHYPALFYIQFYLSFGWYGILLGLVLFRYLFFLECQVRKNFLTLFLFLPIFGWHSFMIMRGAIDYSTSGISYVFWINMLILIVIKNNKSLYARFTGNK